MAEKSRRRRYEIAHVAITLYQQHGYSNVTTDDIARAAEIGTRTYFRYFASKEDAAFPDHEDRVARFQDALDHQPDSSDRLQAIVDVTGRSVRDYFDDPDLYRPRYQLIHTEPALRNHERIANRAYEDAIVGYLTRTPDPVDATLAHAIAGAIIAAVDHLLDAWATDDAFDPSAYTDVLDRIANGFRSAPHHGDGPGAVVLVDDPRLRRDLLRVLAAHRQRDAAPSSPEEPR